MNSLTQKLMEMADACAAKLPKLPTQYRPRFNHLRTPNSYREFTWQIKREKGHPVAVINRKGRLYCRLLLTPGFSYQAMHQDIVDWLNDRLCCEVGK